MDINKLLLRIKKDGASDLHLSNNSHPSARKDGLLNILTDEEIITNEYLTATLNKVTDEKQRETLNTKKEVDLSYAVPGAGRFRVNVLVQRNTLSFAFRVIAEDVSPLDKIGLPKIYAELSLYRKGLLIITGPTGSGKSTTLAAMVNYINDNAHRRIMSIEDPIEYLHPNKKSVVLQIELGRDTESYSGAVRNSLRHDPDVIVVGEMRDRDTIAAALTAAETGHLVMGTLHTNDVAQTIDRIIDVFPFQQQDQLKHQISQVLLGIFSQVLIPRIGGGRVPACEILIANSAVRNMIREGKTHQLINVMQVGLKDGMQTLNQALSILVTRRLILREEALKYATDSEQLDRQIQLMSASGNHDFSYINQGPHKEY